MNERAVVLLIAAMHFINILDFMIVMPLGPDFSNALGIPSNSMGDVAGAYTLAAAVSGIAGSFFLDRFDRRKALAVAMSGLVIATALCGFAWDLYSLLGARVLAGLFGGPAMALSLAVVTDIVPARRRGRAMAAVMTSFSIASIAGVPLALEVANAGGWRAPFFAVAGLGALVTAAGIFLLPALRLHLQTGVKPPGLAMFRLLREPLPLLSYLSITAMMFSAFTIIPHIPTYLVFNLEYSGEQWLRDLVAPLGAKPSVLGPLYLFGGLLSLVVMQFVGRLTDRLGSGTVSWIGAVLVITVIWFWFIDYNPVLPVAVAFMAYMGSMSMRGVPARALDTKIPRAHERASFMSLQSAVQHFALAGAAIMSSRILTENADKSLNGIPTLGWISVAFALLLPASVTIAERLLKRRDGGNTETLVAAGAPVTAPAPPAQVAAGTDT